MKKTKLEPGLYVRFKIKTVQHGEFYSMAEKMSEGVDIGAIADQLTDKIANVSSFSFQSGNPGEAEQEFVVLPPDTLRTALISLQVLRIE